MDDEEAAIEEQQHLTVDANVPTDRIPTPKTGRGEDRGNGIQGFKEGAVTGSPTTAKSDKQNEGNDAGESKNAYKEAVAKKNEEVKDEVGQDEMKNKEGSGSAPVRGSAAPPSQSPVSLKTKTAFGGGVLPELQKVLASPRVSRNRRARPRVRRSGSATRARSTSRARASGKKGEYDDEDALRASASEGSVRSAVSKSATSPREAKLKESLADKRISAPGLSKLNELKNQGKGSRRLTLSDHKMLYKKAYVTKHSRRTKADARSKLELSGTFIILDDPGAVKGSKAFVRIVRLTDLGFHRFHVVYGKRERDVSQAIESKSLLDNTNVHVLMEVTGVRVSDSKEGGYSRLVIEHADVERGIQTVLFRSLTKGSDGEQECEKWREFLANTIQLYRKLEDPTSKI